MIKYNSYSKNKIVHNNNINKGLGKIGNFQYMLTSCCPLNTYGSSKRGMRQWAAEVSVNDWEPAGPSPDHITIMTVNHSGQMKGQVL